MSDFRNYLNEQLQRPSFKAEWDALQPELTIAQAMIDEGKWSDPEAAFGAHRHCTGRYQQVGTGKRKPFSAHPAAPCGWYGDECQN